MDEAEEIKRYKIRAEGREPSSFQGALSAWRGFNYQLAYTVERLTDLLVDKRLHSIRIEGRQDLDMSYQGSPEGDSFPVTFIQLKDTATKYSIASLCEILQRFLSIIREIQQFSSGLADVSFCLILAHRNFDKEVNDIYNHLANPKAPRLPDKILQKCTTQLNATSAETLDLLARLSIEVLEDRGVNRPASLSESSKLPAEESDFLTYSTQFENNAIINIQRVGVETLHAAQDAFNRLRRDVSDAAGSTSLSRIFDRDRVESIVRVPLLKSILGTAQGVAIDQEYLDREAMKIQAMVARQHDFNRDDPFAAHPFLAVPAEWKHIAASLDFKRDILYQRGGLLEKLNNRIASGNSSAVIVHGEPGAGKSALIKRAAICLMESGGIDLIYEIDELDCLVSARESMQRALQNAKRPILFVIDDVFEKDQRADFLRSILRLGNRTAGVPLIVLGTTTNDLKPRHIPHFDIRGQVDFVELRGVTPREKEEICRRFSVPESLARELNSESFLVAMMEATGGEKFRDVLLRVKDRLEQGNFLDLFEVLCAAGRFGMEIPESLLRCLLAERARVLDGDGPRFHGLEDYVRKKERKGQPYFTARHRKIAQEFFNLEEVRYGARNMYSTLVTKVDAADSYERRFLVHLFRRLSIAEQEITRQLLDDVAQKVEACQDAGSVFELYRHWPKVYTNLGKNEKVASLKRRAISAPPIDAAEVEFLVSRFQEHKQWSLAVNSCYTWLEGRGTDAVIETKLLDLHENRELWVAEQNKVESEKRLAQARNETTEPPASCESLPQTERIVSLSDALIETKRTLLAMRKEREAKLRVAHLDVVRGYIDRRWAYILEEPTAPPTLFGKFLRLIGKDGLIDQREASLNAAARWLRNRYNELRGLSRLEVRGKSEAIGEALGHYLKAVEEWRIASFAAHLNSRVLQMQTAGLNYDAIADACEVLVKNWQKETETRRAIRLAGRYDGSDLLNPAIRGRLVSFVFQFGNENVVQTEIEKELKRLSAECDSGIAEFLSVLEPLAKAVRIRGTVEQAAKMIDLGTKWCLVRPVENEQWWRACLCLLHLISKTCSEARLKVFTLAASILEENGNLQKSWVQLMAKLTPGKGFPILPAFPHDSELAGLLLRLLSDQDTVDRSLVEKARSFCERIQASAMTWGCVAELAITSGDYDTVADIFLTFGKAQEAALAIPWPWYAITDSLMERVQSDMAQVRQENQGLEKLKGVIKLVGGGLSWLLKQPPYGSRFLPCMYALKARLLETKGQQHLDDARPYALRAKQMVAFNQYSYALPTYHQI